MNDPRAFEKLIRNSQELLLSKARYFLDNSPGATSDELLAFLERSVFTPVEHETVPCKRCGRATILDTSGAVTHRGADGDLSRGCRAATFTPHGGWDENIPRTWYAAR